MTDNTTAQKPQKKTCWLATASVLCALTMVAYIIMQLLAPTRIYFGVFLSLLVASQLLGIGALLRIYQRYDQLKGANIVILLIVLTTFILGDIGPVIMRTPRSGQIRCERQLESLGQALEQYAREHNDLLPDPEHWCDELIAKTKTPPYTFICNGTDAQNGESSYAMNKAIAGMKFSEIPPYMVLLFEVKPEKADTHRDFPVSERPFAKNDEYHRHDTDKVYQDQWNQVGGGELLSLSNHRLEGGNILFADRHTDFVDREELADLPWVQDEQKGLLWSQQRQKMTQRIFLCKAVALSIIGVLGITGMWKILRRFSPKGHPLFVTVLGLVSGGVGCYFGMFDEEAIYQGKSHYPGIISGGIMGLTVGICYATIIVNMAKQRKTLEGFKGYATSAGMATEVIGAMLVHVILMIIHEEKMPWGMIEGLPFGILTGAILGAISGAIAKNIAVKTSLRNKL